MPLRCALFLGSTRTVRIGPRVAAYVQQQMERRGFEVDVLDPVTTHDGFFMRLMEKPAFHYKEGETVPAPLVDVSNRVKAADCIAVVAPEMNHTVAPGLANMMSYFGASAYAFKPSGICVYSAGLWGGARAGVALRPFLSELGCLPVSSILHIAKAQSQFKEDGGVIEPVTEKTCERMLDQLEWYSHALKSHRDQHGTPSQSYFEQIRGKR
mmetsp:Transcript_7482/g.18400  ORF Transcript_7482/g.18400 Transcript_7482/m.18400 type:complete len:211 (+) Transcript_7482:14-646(+)